MQNVWTTTVEGSDLADISAKARAEADRFFGVKDIRLYLDIDPAFENRDGTGTLKAVIYTCRVTAQNF